MRSPPCLAALLLLAGLASGAFAETKPPKPYQGPLDTIMSTHLWTDVPPTQDFVKATHPDAKAVDFTPLTSQSKPDPVRPKPRDAAGIAALQAELEGDIKTNARKAGGQAVPKKAPAKAAKRRAREPKVSAAE